MEAVKSFTIFLGNPGTGKSTLLNGLAGEIVFECGMSFGQGLTSMLQLHQSKDGVFLGDTPGLSDFVLRKQAAKEIQNALSQDGEYRLIFCIVLEAGQVRPDDIASLEMILECVKIDVPFGILINKMDDDVYNYVSSNDRIQKRLMAYFLSGTHRSTLHFHGVKMLSELYGKSNKMPAAEITKD